MTEVMWHALESIDTFTSSPWGCYDVWQYFINVKNLLSDGVAQETDYEYFVR